MGAVLTDSQLLYRVRGETTDSVVELPDSRILYYAGRGADTTYTENVYGGELDLNGVLSDCWRYIARLDNYMGQSEGDVSVNGPLAQRKMWYYLALSRRAGVAMQVRSIRRGDLTSAASTSGGEHGA